MVVQPGNLHSCLVLSLTGARDMSPFLTALCGDAHLGFGLGLVEADASAEKARTNMRDGSLIFEDIL